MLLPDLHTDFSRGRSGGHSHLFQNFPQFIVIHTVQGFGIVNKAEIDVFLELSCFFDDPLDVGSLVSGSSAFSKTSLNIANLQFLPLPTPNSGVQAIANTNKFRPLLFMAYVNEIRLVLLVVTWQTSKIS